MEADIFSKGKMRREIKDTDTTVLFIEEPTLHTGNPEKQEAAERTCEAPFPEESRNRS